VFTIFVYPFVAVEMFLRSLTQRRTGFSALSEMPLATILDLYVLLRFNTILSTGCFAFLYSSFNAINPIANILNGGQEQYIFCEACRGKIIIHPVAQTR